MTTIRVGDLVRYRNAEFTSTRVHERFVGLVLEVRSRPLGRDRTILVKWNSADERFQQMWIDSSALEVMDAVN